MRLLFIRHGDPDYLNDSLTPRGDREASLLAESIGRYDITYFYVSPLGRAQRTASFLLEKTGKTAVTCGWLQEFPPRILRPGRTKPSIAWDWYPADWTKYPEAYSIDTWTEIPCFQENGIKELNDRICASLDELLAKHGYVREGRVYRPERPNHDTIAFVCHFGIECILIGHLTGISPMLLWHSFCCAPTGVTTMVTEERQKGIANFRTGEFGSTAHLLLGGQEVSRRARYVECFGDDPAGFEVDPL